MSEWASPSPLAAEPNNQPAAADSVHCAIAERSSATSPPRNPASCSSGYGEVPAIQRNADRAASGGQLEQSGIREVIDDPSRCRRRNPGLSREFAAGDGLSKP